MQEFTEYAKRIQPELVQLIRDLCRIPAPSHHEEARAAFCQKWFMDNGFPKVWTDGVLNVLAPVRVANGGALTVMMAHTDTVFPDTAPMPMTEQGGRMMCPGVTDDTANLAVLMLCARYFLKNPPADGRGILFVANSCEEGLGNLKGSRQIVADYGARISDFITLDSNDMNKIVTRSVGSHRYRVQAKTEGGHSFANFGRRNAIEALAALIERLYQVEVPHVGDSKTTYNVGLISGGTSVNTIAQSAEMMYEYRSDNRRCLETMRQTFERLVNEARTDGVEIAVEVVGDRPCAGAVDAARLSALQDRVRASMKAALGVEAVGYASSTDCNIPLAEGIPAVCFGVCRGGGCHTREEWLDTDSLADGCRLLLDFLYRK